MTKTAATSEPLADLSLSRISSSQTTTHGSPSDETNERRGSTSSSLSSCQTADNTSFITLKHSPPANRAISSLDSTFTSTESSSTKAILREPPEEGTNESRTRSSRNRKLTGKAFDLAVSGKLYKAERLARNSPRMSENGRNHGEDDEDGRSGLSLETESRHTSPSPSSRPVNVDIAMNSAEEDVQGKQIDRTQQAEALSNSGLGVGTSQIKPSTHSLHQDVKSAAKDAHETGLPKKRRRLQSHLDNADPPSSNDITLPDDVQSVTDTNSKHQESVPTIKLKFSKREPRKAARGKASMAGQASLRSTRQRLEESLPDQAQRPDREVIISDRVDGASSDLTADSEQAKLSETDIREHQSCHLDCLDEADVLIAFAEYIVNIEEGNVKNESPEEQYTHDLEKEVATVESLQGLKEYCRCDDAGDVDRTSLPSSNHGTAEPS